MRKPFEPRAFRHGGGHSAEIVVFFSQLRDGFGEHVGILRIFLLFFLLSGPDVERSCAVETVGMKPGRLVSVPFFGHHMDQHGSFNFFCLVEGPHHLAHIVAVDRTQIGEAHVFKKHAGNEQLLDAALSSAHRFDDFFPHIGHFVECFGHAHLKAGVGLCRPDHAQIAGHAAYVA